MSRCAFPWRIARESSGSSPPSSVLLLGQHLIHEMGAGRGAWLHVVKGQIQLRDHCLSTGDGAALDGEAAVSFTAQEPTEILLFDVA